MSAFPILELPGEIRDLIYRFILQAGQDLRVRGFGSLLQYERPITTGFLRACKQIHRECQHMLQDKKLFLNCPPYEIPNFLSRLPRNLVRETTSVTLAYLVLRQPSLDEYPPGNAPLSDLHELIMFFEKNTAVKTITLDLVDDAWELHPEMMQRGSQRRFESYWYLHDYEGYERALNEILWAAIYPRLEQLIKSFLTPMLSNCKEGGSNRIERISVKLPYYYPKIINEGYEKVHIPCQACPSATSLYRRPYWSILSQLPLEAREDWTQRTSSMLEVSTLFRRFRPYEEHESKGSVFDFVFKPYGAEVMRRDL